METGLLAKEEAPDFVELRHIDEENRNFISVYLKDVKNKLSILDELSNKIDLLITNINKKFGYKKMFIDKKKGLLFHTDDNKELSLENLSSGEQHEIVLLYEFLFKLKPGSLILIDEPELSLHVGWQTEFLKDLEDVIELSKFDVLIATHSPQIIHDRWDLTVELKGNQFETICNT